MADPCRWSIAARGARAATCRRDPDALATPGSCDRGRPRTCGRLDRHARPARLRLVRSDLSLLMTIAVVAGNDAAGIRGRICKF